MAGDADRDGFTVAGVTLGMDVDNALDVYPAATIEPPAASCYSYGKAIGKPDMAGQVIRYRGSTSDLTMRFEAPRRGGRLVRIDYDRRIDPSTYDLRALFDRLARRHGSPVRVLHRRKMEPAGRIIGFEWQTVERASLRVVLHDDFRTPGDRYRLSFLARNAVAASRQTRCLPSYCSPCIAP